MNFSTYFVSIYPTAYAHCTRVGVLYPDGKITIDAPDYMITTSEKRCKFSGLKISNQGDVKYLPVNLQFKLFDINKYTVINCSIKSISIKNFANITRITELILNYNLIETIETDSFLSLQNLFKFSIAGNRLTTIDGKFFSKIKTVKFINFSQNNISLIPVGLFENFPHLQIIDFRYCKITKLEKNLLDKNNQLIEVIFINNLISYIDKTNWNRFKQADYVDLTHNQCINGCYVSNNSQKYRHCHSINEDLFKDLSKCELINSL